MEHTKGNYATKYSKRAEHQKQKKCVWIILLKQEKHKLHRGAHSNVRWSDNEPTSPKYPLSSSLSRILRLPCDWAEVPGASRGPSSLAQSCPVLSSQPCPLRAGPCSALSKQSLCLVLALILPYSFHWLSLNTLLSQFLSQTSSLLKVFVSLYLSSVPRAKILTCSRYTTYLPT